MEEKRINKSIVFSIISAFILAIIVLGASFAYFRAAGETNTQEITTSKLQMVFDDNTPIVNAELQPITTDEVLTKAAKKTFRIAKTDASEDLYVKIKLSDLTIPEVLAQYDLKWALYQGTTPITTGDFGGKTSGEIVMATNQLINVIDDPEVIEDGVEYNLYLWINETNLDQGQMMGQTMTARVTATGVSTKENTLASLILGENNTNVTTSEPIYSTSSTDRGLYVQSGDVTRSEMGFPTYYFRGSSTNETINPNYVMNNYVKFGTYPNDILNTVYIDGVKNKDKLVATAGEDIVWRVMRINEDGSIRLITQLNLLDDIVWDTTEPHTSNYIDSNIKTQIDTWYNNNILTNPQLDSMMVKSTYCINFVNSLNNLESKKPTFVCSPQAEKNYSKIGLANGDDLVYGGALHHPDVVMPNKTYLNNNSDFFIAGGPSITQTYYWNQSMAYPSSSNLVGRISSTVTTADSAVRFVINLRPDVIVKSGDGLSAETAYIIQ